MVTSMLNEVYLDLKNKNGTSQVAGSQDKGTGGPSSPTMALAGKQFQPLGKSLWPWLTWFLFDFWKSSCSQGPGAPEPVAEPPLAIIRKGVT